MGAEGWEGSVAYATYMMGQEVGLPLSSMLAGFQLRRLSRAGAGWMQCFLSIMRLGRACEPQF